MKTIVIILIFFLGFNVTAQEEKGKSVRHEILVNGKCGMCKKRIERAAIGVNGVKYADWHADDLRLKVVINETKTSIIEVKKAIAEVGHDTDEVKASEHAYDNLHACCKYERLDLHSKK